MMTHQEWFSQMILRRLMFLVFLALKAVQAVREVRKSLLLNVIKVRLIQVQEVLLERRISMLEVHSKLHL